MWRKIYNTSRLWTICKNIDFKGGSPSYLEDKNKEQLLISFAEGYIVFVEYISANMTCLIKLLHKNNIPPWEKDLSVRVFAHSDKAMENFIQKHINKIENLI